MLAYIWMEGFFFDVWNFPGKKKTIDPTKLRPRTWVNHRINEPNVKKTDKSTHNLYNKTLFGIHCWKKTNPCKCDPRTWVVGNRIILGVQSNLKSKRKSNEACVQLEYYQKKKIVFLVILEHYSRLIVDLDTLFFCSWIMNEDK